MMHTNKDRGEEESHRNVENGGRHVEEPVGGHGEEPQEKQEEEQTALVLLHLTHTSLQQNKKQNQ